MEYDRLEEDSGNKMNALSNPAVNSDSDDDDSDYDNYNSLNSSAKKWWFCEPAIKKNKWAAVLVLLLLFAGIGIIVAGIVLEILFHTGMTDIFRGFIFFAIGGLMLIPSVYALLHIYLAAKRIGRVRFSSVWFFTN